MENFPTYVLAFICVVCAILLHPFLALLNVAVREYLHSLLTFLNLK